MGVEMDESYRYISLEFQIYVTQAADEKNAIEKREAFLEKEFDYFRSNKNMIRGDLEYEKNHGKSVDPLRDLTFNWDLRNYSSKR